MSTTVTFAGNLTRDPELLHTLDGKEFVACRVVVNRRIRNEAGEWVDGAPTEQSVTTYGTAVNHFYDPADRGNRVVAHGQLRNEAWRDGGTGGKRTKQVVTADNRCGEVGPSLKFGAAGLNRQTAPTATTATTEN